MFLDMEVIGICLFAVAADKRIVVGESDMHAIFFDARCNVHIGAFVADLLVYFESVVEVDPYVANLN